MPQAPEASVLDLADESYLLLTTFTRDGRPKPTPVWAAADGDALLVITDPTAWKVRRLRHTGRVTLRPCDSRGRPRSGPELSAVGTVVDGPGAERAVVAIRRKYGVQARAIEFFQAVARVVRRRPKQAPAGIELRDPAGTSDPGRASTS